MHRVMNGIFKNTLGMDNELDKTKNTYYPKNLWSRGQTMVKHRMEISKNGLDLIKSFEGFRSKPYLCPAGVPTIGYGTTLYPNHMHVSMHDRPINEAEALSILKYWIDRTYGQAVDRYVQKDITQNQYDALVSFAYNLGIGALQKSTLLKRVNQGKNKRASNEFLKWDHANGKKLAGLTRRRKAERTLYLT